MDALYTATAHATGGRNGSVETSDHLLKFNLSVPKGMGGPGKEGTTNPEQLFACGYSACFAGAIDFVAKQKKITLSEVHVIADVAIAKDATSFALAVELKAYLPGLSKSEATDLINAAHQICPYSKATRGNVDVKLTVLDKL